MDVTEKISESQAAGFFWSILDMNILPMIVWNTSGEIVYANDSFCTILGYEQNDFESGKVSWKSITPEGEGFEEQDQICLEALKVQPVAPPYDKRYIAKDGSLLTVRLFNAVNEPGDEQGIAIVLPV